MGYCDGSLVARIDGHPDFVKEIMVGQKYIYAPYCSPVIWLWIVSGSHGKSLDCKVLLTL